MSRESSVSELLEKHGLSHEQGSNGRRYIKGPSGALGLMDALEAMNLVALLEDAYERNNPKAD